MTDQETLECLRFACEEVQEHLARIEAEAPTQGPKLIAALYRRLAQFAHEVRAVLHE